MEPAADPADAPAEAGRAVAVSEARHAMAQVLAEGSTHAAGADGTALRFAATGFIDPPNEGPFPGADGPAFPVTEYDLDVVLELGGDRLRIDRVGVNPGPGFVIDQIERIDGEVGVAEGVNALGLPLGAIPSDRVAALVRTQRLLNPTLLVADALSQPGSILGASLAWDGSQLVLRVTLANDVAPIALDVALLGPPRILRAKTYENDLLLRDSEIEVEYEDWTWVAGFGRMPHRVEVWHEGYLLRSETRSGATTAVPIAAGEIEVPADTPPADPALVALGRRSSQAQLSFPPPITYPDGRPAGVVPVELAPGVFFLSGTLHNSMLVEQAERLVLVEAPGYPERSVAIAEWAEAQYPDKSITHVIATHHHSDHTAGLREFVARGATVIVGEATEAFFADDVFQRSSSLVPDTLSTLDVDPVVIGVPDDATWTLDDPVRPVQTIPVDSVHADDMVVAYLPQQGFVFNSDLYTPDFPATNQEALLQAATELNDAIVEFDLDVTLMPSGHGFVIHSYAEFLAETGL